MYVSDCDSAVLDLIHRYLEKLALPSDDLSVTTSRNVFAEWIGRPVPFRIGGAYSQHPRTGAHRVFVHLERLDLSKPGALEIVVAEELIHMRDHIRGDYRRHSHHGYDRIAVEVERVTGYAPAQQRDIFLPRPVRPYRHVYTCRRCGTLVARRRRGTWSCGRCSPRFNRRLVLREVPADQMTAEMQTWLHDLNQRLRQQNEGLVHFDSDHD